MNNKKQIGILKDQIETELKATRYGLYCIEVAFGADGESNVESIVHSKTIPQIDSTSIESTPVDDTYSGRMDNYSIARGAANRISAMLVGTVYEILIQDNYKYWNKYNSYDHEEMKFLQCVRNGVFHSNRFKLDDYKGGAEWRGIEITEDMEGNVVFTEIDWDNRRLIRSPDLPKGQWYSEEDVNEGILCAGDGLALIQTIIKMLEEL